MERVGKGVPVASGRALRAQVGAVARAALADFVPSPLPDHWKWQFSRQGIVVRPVRVFVRVLESRAAVGADNPFMVIVLVPAGGEGGIGSAALRGFAPILADCLFGRRPHRT